MNRIPVEGSTIVLGTVTLVLAGATWHFWRLTNNKVRQLEAARMNVISTLDRVKEKGTVIGENIRDVQERLEAWAAKCDNFQVQASLSIEQVKRDLHSQMMVSEDEDYIQQQVEQEEEEFEDQEQREQYTNGAPRPRDVDRVLAEVDNNVALTVAPYEKHSHKKSTAQQQLSKIQDQVNQASSLLSGHQIYSH
eukprot:TRINITY_DN3640_c0_g1_i1.p2 TRINITY_DN3640_c0_g1~~TRINITY_DN3640_c0_g1_i1.p2  ORF type:complete len:193 (+),score=22.13 TRINITY_DN3640_c0_g1_i1:152-730(+)